MFLGKHPARDSELARALALTSALLVGGALKTQTPQDPPAATAPNQPDQDRAVDPSIRFDQIQKRITDSAANGTVADRSIVLKDLSQLMGILEATPNGDPVLRAKILSLRGAMHFQLGDPTAASADLLSAFGANKNATATVPLTIATWDSDKKSARFTGISQTRSVAEFLGDIAIEQGDYPRAQEFYAQAAALSKSLGLSELATVLDWDIELLGALIDPKKLDLLPFFQTYHQEGGLVGGKRHWETRLAESKALPDILLTLANQKNLSDDLPSPAELIHLALACPNIRPSLYQRGVVELAELHATEGDLVSAAALLHSVNISNDKLLPSGRAYKFPTDVWMIANLVNLSPEERQVKTLELARKNPSLPLLIRLSADQLLKNGELQEGHELLTLHRASVQIDAATLATRHPNPSVAGFITVTSPSMPLTLLERQIRVVPDLSNPVDRTYLLALECATSLALADGVKDPVKQRALADQFAVSGLTLRDHLSQQLGADAEPSATILNLIKPFPKLSESSAPALEVLTLISALRRPETTPDALRRLQKILTQESDIPKSVSRILAASTICQTALAEASLRSGELPLAATAIENITTHTGLGESRGYLHLLKAALARQSGDLAEASRLEQLAVSAFEDYAKVLNPQPSVVRAAIRSLAFDVSAPTRTRLTEVAHGLLKNPELTTVVVQELAARRYQGFDVPLQELLKAESAKKTHRHEPGVTSTTDWLMAAVARSGGQACVKELVRICVDMSTRLATARPGDPAVSVLSCHSRLQQTLQALTALSADDGFSAVSDALEIIARYGLASDPYFFRVSLARINLDQSTSGAMPQNKPDPYWYMASSTSDTSLLALWCRSLLSGSDSPDQVAKRMAAIQILLPRGISAAFLPQEYTTTLKEAAERYVRRSNSPVAALVWKQLMAKTDAAPAQAEATPPAQSYVGKPPMESARHLWGIVSPFRPLATPVLTNPRGQLDRCYDFLAAVRYLRPKTEKDETKPKPESTPVLRPELQNKLQVLGLICLGSTLQRQGDDPAALTAFVAAERLLGKATWTEYTAWLAASGIVDASTEAQGLMLSEPVGQVQPRSLSEAIAQVSAQGEIQRLRTNRYLSNGPRADKPLLPETWQISELSRTGAALATPYGDSLSPWLALPINELESLVTLQGPVPVAGRVVGADKRNLWRTSNLDKGPETIFFGTIFPSPNQIAEFSGSDPILQHRVWAYGQAFQLLNPKSNKKTEGSAPQWWSKIEDEVTTVRLAHKQITQGDLSGALAHLANTKHYPTLNDHGVIATLRGDHQAAKAYFEDAVRSTYAAAVAQADATIIGERAGLLGTAIANGGTVQPGNIPSTLPSDQLGTVNPAREGCKNLAILAYLQGDYSTALRLFYQVRDAEVRGHYRLHPDSLYRPLDLENFFGAETLTLRRATNLFALASQSLEADSLEQASRALAELPAAFRDCQMVRELRATFSLHRAVEAKLLGKELREITELATAAEVAISEVDDRAATMGEVIPHLSARLNLITLRRVSGDKEAADKLLTQLCKDCLAGIEALKKGIELKLQSLTTRTAPDGTTADITRQELSKKVSLLATEELFVSALPNLLESAPAGAERDAVLAAYADLFKKGVDHGDSVFVEALVRPFTQKTFSVAATAVPSSAPWNYICAVRNPEIARRDNMIRQLVESAYASSVSDQLWMASYAIDPLATTGSMIQKLATVRDTDPSQFKLTTNWLEDTPPELIGRAGQVFPRPVLSATASWYGHRDLHWFEPANRPVGPRWALIARFVNEVAKVPQHMAALLPDLEVVTRTENLKNIDANISANLAGVDPNLWYVPHGQKGPEKWNWTSVLAASNLNEPHPMAALHLELARTLRAHGSPAALALLLRYCDAGENLAMARQVALGADYSILAQAPWLADLPHRASLDVGPKGWAALIRFVPQELRVAAPLTAESGFLAGLREALREASSRDGTESRMQIISDANLPVALTSSLLSRISRQLKYKFDIEPTELEKIKSTSDIQKFLNEAVATWMKRRQGKESPDEEALKDITGKAEVQVSSELQTVGLELLALIQVYESLQKPLERIRISRTAQQLSEVLTPPYLAGLPVETVIVQDPKLLEDISLPRESFDPRATLVKRQVCLETPNHQMLPFVEIYERKRDNKTERFAVTGEFPLSYAQFLSTFPRGLDVLGISLAAREQLLLNPSGPIFLTADLLCMQPLKGLTILAQSGLAHHRHLNNFLMSWNWKDLPKDARQFMERLMPQLRYDTDVAGRQAAYDARISTLQRSYQEGFYADQVFARAGEIPDRLSMRLLGLDFMTMDKGQNDAKRRLTNQAQAYRNASQAGLAQNAQYDIFNMLNPSDPPRFVDVLETSFNPGQTEWLCRYQINTVGGKSVIVERTGSVSGLPPLCRQLISRNPALCSLMHIDFAGVTTDPQQQIWFAIRATAELEGGKDSVIKTITRLGLNVDEMRSALKVDLNQPMTEVVSGFVAKKIEIYHELARRAGLKYTPPSQQDISQSMLDQFAQIRTQFETMKAQTVQQANKTVNEVVAATKPVDCWGIPGFLCAYTQDGKLVGGDVPLLGGSIDTGDKGIKVDITSIGGFSVAGTPPPPLRTDYPIDPRVGFEQSEPSAITQTPATPPVVTAPQTQDFARSPTPPQGGATIWFPDTGSNRSSLFGEIASGQWSALGIELVYPSAGSLSTYQFGNNVTIFGNGMNVPFLGARLQAQQLADQLHEPVLLHHNPPNRFPDVLSQLPDVAAAKLNFKWDAKVDPSAQIGAGLVSTLLAQNPCTRITYVAHSEGEARQENVLRLAAENAALQGIAPEVWKTLAQLRISRVTIGGAHEPSFLPGKIRIVQAGDIVSALATSPDSFLRTLRGDFFDPATTRVIPGFGHGWQSYMERFEEFRDLVAPPPLLPWCNPPPTPSK